MENKFCRDCVHSRADSSANWRLQCVHPQVLGHSAYSLASPHPRGVDASDERAKGFWHGKCGRRGALWEMKPWSAPV